MKSSISVWHWLCLLFPIVSAVVSFLCLRNGSTSTFCLTLLPVSLICITAIPFNFVMLALSRHNARAKVVAVAVPVGIWLLFSLLNTITGTSGGLQIPGAEALGLPEGTSGHNPIGFSLMLLACEVINLLPLWCSLFLVKPSGEPEKEAISGISSSSLSYWSWPMLIHALFAVCMAVRPQADSVCSGVFHWLVPALLILMAFSFIIYLVLFLVWKGRRQSAGI